MDNGKLKKNNTIIKAVWNELKDGRKHHVRDLTTMLQELKDDPLITKRSVQKSVWDLRLFGIIPKGHDIVHIREGWNSYYRLVRLISDDD